MESPESIVTLIIMICLGVGLVAAIVGVFLFNNFNWWDKL